MINGNEISHEINDEIKLWGHCLILYFRRLELSLVKTAFSIVFELKPFAGISLGLAAAFQCNGDSNANINMRLS